METLFKQLLLGLIAQCSVVYSLDVKKLQVKKFYLMDAVTKLTLEWDL